MAEAGGTIFAVEDQAERLAASIARAERIVALTGAGISTECGVPDFRSPDSPWRRHPPIGFKEWLSSPERRAEAWRRKFIMDDSYAGARPGRVHRALVNLWQQGRLATVVTQNIEGLHQAAGLPQSALVELHGNGTYAHCLDCGSRYELTVLRQGFEATGEPPSCACGGLVKSATISFGQSLPKEALRRAKQAALACDLFLVLGTSLLVQPAASLPAIARDNGAALVIINREATPLDGLAELVLREDIGTMLQPWSDPY